MFHDHISDKSSILLSLSLLYRYAWPFWLLFWCCCCVALNESKTVIIIDSSSSGEEQPSNNRSTWRSFYYFFNNFKENSSRLLDKFYTVSRFSKWLSPYVLSKLILPAYQLQNFSIFMFWFTLDMNIYFLGFVIRKKVLWIYDTHWWVQTQFQFLSLLIVLQASKQRSIIQWTTDNLRWTIYKDKSF